MDLWKLKSLNESASDLTEAILPMDMFGDLNESHFMMLDMELTEAFAGDAVEKNYVFDIISECVTDGNTEAVDAINEGFLGGVGDKLKKIWEKIVSFLKGILNKIKVSFIGISKNIEKFEKIVVPEINKRKGTKLETDFRYEGRPWDLKALEAFTSAADYKEFGPELDEFRKTADEYKTIMANIKSENADNKEVGKFKDQPTTIGNFDDSENKEMADELDRKEKELNKKISGDEDLAKGFNEKAKTIRGGEKVEMGLDKVGLTNMINFITGYKTAGNVLTKEYDAMLTKANDIVKVLDGISKVTVGNVKDTVSHNDAARSDFAGEARRRVANANHKLELYSKAASTYVSAFNAAKGKAMTLRKEALGEFIPTLTRFANAKVEK